MPAAHCGAALSAYCVFFDLSLGITEPLAGLIAGNFGYESVYLFATVAAMLRYCMERTRKMHWSASPV